MPRGVPGAAANRRGSACRACQTLPLPALGDPLPRLVKERSQLPSSRSQSTVTGQKTDHPRNYHRRAGGGGGGPSSGFLPFPNSEDFKLSQKVSPRSPSRSTASLALILGSGQGLDKKKKKNKNNPWGGGGKRVLFLCPDPAPSQRQGAVLDEIRNQGQGPSPGPRWSHSARAKVQGRFPGTCPTHTLLITNGKRNQLGPKLRSRPGRGGPPGTRRRFFGAPLASPAGGNRGDGKRSHRVCVSKCET